MPQKHHHDRADATQHQQKIVAAVNSTIEPPSYLSAKERVHFDNIVSEFTKSELNPMRLELCALLANTMQRRLDEMRQLRKEGSIVTGATGGPIINPRCTLVSRLNGDIVKLRTHLLADGRQAIGARKTRAMNKAVEQQAEAALTTGSASLIHSGLNGST